MSTQDPFDTKKILWDLSDLFSAPDDPALLTILDTSPKKAAEFALSYKEKLASLTPIELLTAITTKETLLTPLYKVSQYASLSYAVATNNSTIKSLQSRIEDVYTETSNHLLFFGLEIGSFSAQHLTKLLKDTALSPYAYMLKRYYDTAQFDLSEPEEKIINIKDITGVDSHQTLYGDLTASFSFKLTVDGERKERTGSEVRSLRLHPDQQTRQRAMKTFFKRYKDEKITIEHIFNATLKDFNTERKLRGYSSPISVRNQGNDLPDSVVDLLHNVTTSSNTLVQRYYTLKKRCLGLTSMTLADIYAPLPASSQVFTYPEAQQLVLDGFQAFDSEFYTIARSFFEQNRIHAPVLKHKRGGAFCSGATPDVAPYILLNFLGKPRDVATMAHEIGHGIHDVLASKQPLSLYHPILPLAETASVFSEMIISDLIKNRLTSKEEKIIFLCEKLEDIFATSHRQNMFSTFEKQAHHIASTSRLTADTCCDIYHSLLKGMFGKSVTIPKEYLWEWATIPHFIDYPFYVYAYNFGNLLVLSLYESYLEEGSAFIPKIKTCLATGSARSPIDITQSMGIDIRQKTFWDKSIRRIENLLEELEDCLS